MYDAWHSYKCEIVRTYTDEVPDKIPIEDNEEFKSVRNAVVKSAAEISSPSAQPDREIDYDYAELKERKMILIISLTTRNSVTILCYSTASADIISRRQTIWRTQSGGFAWRLTEGLSSPLTSFTRATVTESSPKSRAISSAICARLWTQASATPSMNTPNI